MFLLSRHRRGPLLGGVLALLVWASDARAVPPTTQVILKKGLCRHTLPLKTPMAVTLRWKKDERGKIVPDGNPWAAFLNRLEKQNPGLDYSDCATQLFYTVRNRAQELWAKEGKRYGGEHFRDWEWAVARYFRKRYEKGPITPVSPMGEFAFKFNREEEKLFSTNMRKNCEVGSEHLDGRFMRRLPTYVKGLSTQCKGKLGASYASAILGTLPDRKQCDNDPKGCEVRKAQVQKAAWYLAQAGLMPNDPYLSAADVVSPCFTQAWLYSERSIQSLRALADSLEPQAQCVQLLPGQSAKITDESPTGIPPRYVLRRLEDRVRQANGKKVPVYEAVVDLRFSQEAFNGRESRGPGVQRKWEGIVRRCFKQHERYMRTSRGDLKVVLAGDAPSVQPKPPLVDVVIAAEATRSHSEKWSPDIEKECGVVIHEVFHHLGLVDTYSESEKGVIINPDGSLTEVKEDAPVLAYQCRNTASTGDIMNWSYDTEFQSKLKASGLYGHQEALLFPAEFRAITQPGCQSVNRNYYLCARDAYQSTRNISGGCTKGLPDVCYTPEEWLK